MKGTAWFKLILIKGGGGVGGGSKLLRRGNPEAEGRVLSVRNSLFWAVKLYFDSCRTVQFGFGVFKLCTL